MMCMYEILPLSLFLSFRRNPSYFSTDREGGSTRQPSAAHSSSIRSGQNMSYKDGTTPPKDVLKSWLDLCFLKFEKEKSKGAIAVHCVAGLGRAPLLVAIALIESGHDYTDAVQLIRKKRSGCINRAQLEFLKQYEPTRSKGCCSIM